MGDELFAEVHSRLQGAQRHEWYDADCPFCGKERKRGQVHFSYNETGFKCFVCGAKGGLKALADRLDVRCSADWKPAERKAPPPKPVARWRESPDKLLTLYHDHPERVSAWQAYKPLTADTIERFGFGYGRLPFQRREDGEWYLGLHHRLIVPLWQGERLAALRGRAIEPTDTGAKWMSATGSVMTPFGLDDLGAGKVIFICENYVDAAWLMQERPSIAAVGVGGVGGWREEYTFAVARAKPRLVVVVFDNDLPGQAQGAMRAQLEAEWRADPKHHNAQPPASNGLRLRNDLRRAGLPAELYEWSTDAPAKADVGWLLSQGKGN